MNTFFADIYYCATAQTTVVASTAPRTCYHGRFIATPTRSTRRYHTKRQVEMLRRGVTLIVKIYWYKYLVKLHALLDALMQI